MVDVNVEAMADGDGLIKLSDQAWELNVVASLPSLPHHGVGHRDQGGLPGHPQYHARDE
jgi:hypothetical protein